MIQHFCRVNRCDRATFEEHWKAAGDLWLERRGEWSVDFGKYASLVDGRSHTWIRSRNRV